MTTLLRIDASARTEGSHSRELADVVEAAWFKANPEGEVIVRDLAREPVALINNDTIAGYYTPPEQMDEKLKSATALSDKLIAEVMLADTLLISVPMYNFSVPAVLKAWIDQVVRINHTFSYDPENGFAGLISNKTAYVTTAVGAQFTGTPFEAFDFLRPYLKSLLAFLGFEKVEVFSVESTTIDEQQMAINRQEALQQIEASFSKARQAAA
ncbi:MAG: NAD(P)H-dependent oxidoreductase [Gammaproteobacteria bacterium]|nr:NAD(P)H-dependent oxidoreductase [Gammaproteobacteria bacterium]